MVVCLLVEEKRASVVVDVRRERAGRTSCLRHNVEPRKYLVHCPSSPLQLFFLLLHELPQKFRHVDTSGRFCLLGPLKLLQRLGMLVLRTLMWRESGDEEGCKVNKSELRTERGKGCGRTIS